MNYAEISTIKIVENQNELSGCQKTQFKKIIVEGLKEKFWKYLKNDDESIFKIIDLWISYGFMPTDETFCAVNSLTGEVLSIVLLNNFKEPDLFKVILCALKGFSIIGVIKTFRLASSFYKLDMYNKKIEDKNIISEIYLVSTREDLRGMGIGTVLLDHVLKYLNTKCNCGEKDFCICKIKLLVFASNPARKLYERLGFKEVKCVKTPDIEKAFGNKYDALVWMEK